MMTAAEQSRLIEAGFAAFAQAQQPLPIELAIDLRIAFYAGAQHMFSSMVRMARGIDANVSISTIENELKEFADECALRSAPVAGSA